MPTFQPERFAEVDVELAGIEAFLGDLADELEDMAPNTDKQGHLWVRTNAATDSAPSTRTKIAAARSAHLSARSSPAI